MTNPHQRFVTIFVYKAYVFKIFMGLGVIVYRYNNVYWLCQKIDNPIVNKDFWGFKRPLTNCMF